MSDGWIGLDWMGYPILLWHQEHRSRAMLKITPKIASFDPNFTFCFPKSHKNPGVGGWVHTFGKSFPNKTVFLGVGFHLNTKHYSVLHKKVCLGLGVQVHVMTKAHKALTVVCDCMQYLVHLAIIVEKNSTYEIFSSKIAHKMCISRHSWIRAKTV